MALRHQDAAGPAVLQPIEDLTQDPEARRHDAAGRPRVHALGENLHRQRPAEHAAQRRGGPEVLVVAAARVQADHQIGADAIGELVDVGRQVRAAAFLRSLDQHDAPGVRDALGLERLDGGQRREGGVAIVARAAPEQSIAAPHRRPRSAVGGPADHLRLLVAVAVEQHGLAARARDLHQDDRCPPLEAYHLDGHALDLAPPGPVGDEAHGPVDVAVLGPPGVEHGRLGRDADVLGEGGNDVVVPGLLDQGARAVGIDGHGRILCPDTAGRARLLATEC